MSRESRSTFGQSLRNHALGRASHDITRPVRLASGVGSFFPWQHHPITVLHLFRELGFHLDLGLLIPAVLVDQCGYLLGN